MKITLTIDCPGMDPKSAHAHTLLNLVEAAWDEGYWRHLRPHYLKINQWWFDVEGGETRYMPEEEPDQSRDTFVPHPDDLELNRLLMRLWINKPIIDHGLLLYSEAITEARKIFPKDTSLERSAIVEVRQELNELYRLAAKRLNLTQFDA